LRLADATAIAEFDPKLTRRWEATHESDRGTSQLLSSKNNATKGRGAGHGLSKSSPVADALSGAPLSNCISYHRGHRSMTVLKQVGALPVRRSRKGVLEVLLVSSRDTGRWVIPKGWPSKRMTDTAAAAREARQEAGVSGKIASKSYGTYRYRKIDKSRNRVIEVTVYVLRVKKEKKRWQEQDQRQRAWFDIEAAARKVREPRLRSLIAGLSKP